jgi:hypothetical protein
MSLQANGAVLPKFKLTTMRKLFSIIFAVLILPAWIYAQGITSGSISGHVINEQNELLPGAIVTAIHMPSGSKYITATQKDGNFNLQSVRVGGPYTIIISYTGYETDTVKNAQVILGEDLNLQEVLHVKSTHLSTLEVSATKNTIMTSSKNGAGNVMNRNQISSLPTISRSMTDFTRLTPEAGGNGMLGKGGKSNNVSIDGAAFNNAFGLGLESANTPGANANAQPISLDAIEQISVDLSPYSVKQSGFTGAGVNAVTRSGDNEFRGSVYYYFRNQQLIGQQVGSIQIPRTDFNEHTFGFRVGGPIIKNKLFFFGNYEAVNSTQPGAAYIAGRANSGGKNVSNISAGSLDTLSAFLQSAYQYNAGSYEQYNIPIENKKFLVKLDWNINDKNKASLRYNQLTSSSSFGATSSLNAIGYSNNGFSRNNNIYSITGELSSILSNRASNRFFVSYTSLPDYRNYFGTLFPVVNITDNGKTYTFGTNNAARNNSVEQKISQVQDDISYTLSRHKLSAGVSFQYFNFSNDFTINPQGTYTFNSLANFYNAAPAGTNTPVGVSTGMGLPSGYSLNYTVQPGRAVTHVNPKMSQLGVYIQDEWAVTNALKLTGGVRLDAISFIGTPTNNPAVTGMSFQDAAGHTENFSTNTSPGTKMLLSPKLGFNWALTQDRSVQLRGGTGIFTGNVPFTYISATFGTNGLNEGAISATNAAAAANYPFSPVPAYYKPKDGTTSSTYEVDLVSKHFKLPQSWRSTLAVDWKLPSNFIASIEGIYSKDINAPFYQNVNLNTSTAVTATDGRMQYASNRINPTITGAYLLKNINLGRQYFLTASVNRQFSGGWFTALSYTYGNAKDGFSFLSTTASGAFNALPVVGNSNAPVLAYSQFDLRHRVVASTSYKFNYLKNRLSTSVGLFFEAAQQGRGSYTYGGTGDVNKDGVTSNDLIFVPKDISQINLVASPTATVQQQWDALNAFISGSKYLSSRRGMFAERNGVLLPWYYQADMRVAQDLSAWLLKNKARNTLEFTVDILNLTNLLDKNWGEYKIMANTTPITALSASTFQVNPALLKQGEFVPDTNLSSTINPSASSRYRVQIGIRYSFN